jgi:hypothetical protein
LVFLAAVVLLLTSIIPIIPVNTAQAAGNPLNGSSRRLFYVFGRNPNTIDDVKAALGAGANALEPDVQVGASGDLVVAHEPNQSGKISLVDYLDKVHDEAFDSNLGLVVFDVKSEAASPDHGLEILKAVRAHLNISGIAVVVIISVATRDDGAIFDKLIGPNAEVQLGPREGVQIDEEDNAGNIVNYFVNEKHYEGNIGFGDGTIGPGPHLPRAIDGAVGIRAATGYPRAVTYVYTLENIKTMNAFIDAGVDGIIPDDIFRLPSGKLDPKYVERLKIVVDGRSDIFLARRDNNPFRPLNEAYALKVKTSDDEFWGREGTDADLTFTLEGTQGTSSVTVNTGYIIPLLLDSHRMEAGQTDWVTISSKDLGMLKSITIHNDGTGHGPDWKLHDITVYSARWLKPDLSYHYTATLNDWIDGDSSKTLPFRVDEFVWGGFASSSDGTVTNPWKQVTEGYNAVAPGGTIHVAAGLYREKQILTKPCKLEFLETHGPGPAVIGSP